MLARGDGRKRRAKDPWGSVTVRMRQSQLDAAKVAARGKSLSAWVRGLVEAELSEDPDPGTAPPLASFAATCLVHEHCNGYGVGCRR